MFIKLRFEREEEDILAWWSFRSDRSYILRKNDGKSPEGVSIQHCSKKKRGKETYKPRCQSI
jgi:hypothetical protein